MYTTKFLTDHKSENFKVSTILRKDGHVIDGERVNVRDVSVPKLYFDIMDKNNTGDLETFSSFLSMATMGLNSVTHIEQIGGSTYIISIV